MGYTLAQINDSGATRWVLTKDGQQVKEWYFAPLAWVRISCLLHGYGWPHVNR